jgi:hypothetical protein
MMVKGARYSWPDAGADFYLHAIRYQFVRILDEERDEVRKKLTTTVRAAYRSMFEILESHEGGTPVSRTALDWNDVYESDAFMHWLDQPGPEFEDAVDPFLSAVKSWMDRFNLRVLWLGDAGIRTIRALESDLDWERRPSWVIRSCEIPHGLTAAELEFQFTHQFGFGPVMRSRKTMRDEVRREFDKAFNTWFQNLDKRLEQRGYEKNPGWDDPERDIRWFVRFQCKGQEYADIAEGQEEVTASAVSKAVKKAADLLGIKRRKARRGRPSKKKLT